MPAPERDLIVKPTSSAPIVISLEPARNVIYSLALVAKAEDISGLGDWVFQTAAALTAEERHVHTLVMNGLFFAVNPKRSWPSFPTYLNHLAAMPPTTLRDKLLDAYASIPITSAETCIDPDDTPMLIEKESILADADAFLSFLRERFPAEHIDAELEREAYAYVVDPPAMQKLIVSHLRHMWDTYLAAEWQRVKPMLQDAVDAFKQIDLSQMSKAEAWEFITGHKLEGGNWEQMLEWAEQVIFVPSAHVGPYLGKFKAEKALGVIFGARLPEGTRFHAPDLSRTEVVVRLNALADDTRLRILKLISEEGEQCSQDIMYRLDLSQSATSRHLKQLSATGYLSERRHEGAKCYALNPDRIKNTLRAVSAFLISG